jgi:hypothetical protein
MTGIIASIGTLKNVNPETHFQFSPLWFDRLTMSGFYRLTMSGFYKLTMSGTTSGG